MLTKFIPLKIHSAFSLAEGMLHVEDIIDLCVLHNLPAAAITDTNNLFGAFQFSQKAIKKGVQPIIGCKILFELPILQNRLQNNYQSQALPLTFYAKNKEGYRNLVRLSSEYYRNLACHQKQGVNLDTLFQNAEGLIVLHGGAQGFFNRLKKENFILCAEVIDRFVKTFGHNFYIEISRQEPFYSSEDEQDWIQIALDKNIPLVAAPEIFFKSVHDVSAHDALLCIAEGTYIMEENRRHSHVDFAFFSQDQMVEIYSDVPEALENTIVIAQSCGFAVQPHAPIFPEYDTPLGQEEELRTQAREGLLIRLQEQVYQPHMTEEDKQRLLQEYLSRMEFELDTIIKMGFSGYFLIVADFIKWAKLHNIPVGPGRGSGAGSVVAWALTITDPDPIRFALLFERFLNPERISMPDFDIDFCQERRDEVIDYVRKKYGDERVAQIITFGKLQARAVVRDVGRILQMPYSKVDRISKMIPSNPANPITLSEAIEQDAELRTLRDTDEMVKKLLEIGLRLEGLYRHASTHAAGVVISGCPLEDIVALYYDPKSQMPATQFNMKDVEPVGLLKFDFLGLKTLTVLQETIALLAHKGIRINLSSLPLDDTKTFQMLQRMETIGVFQFEGAGMREALGGIKPDRIEDIIALGALYRPGPMDNIPRYIACKHGRETPDYLHPLLEGILKETFGVMIYQEQVMQIAQVLANYSLGGADLLRRAMGKKIKEEMDQQRATFVQGAAQNNVPAEKASMIFDQVAKFAGYGFNKSHATAYAIITYQTAYFKANHPVEFMAATMTHDRHNTDKLAVYRQELNRMQIPLLPPDVNSSYVNFHVEILNDSTLGIRYALAAIKNVGAAAMAELVAEREKNGSFLSVTDFFVRVSQVDVNRRQLESLICAGALDSIHRNRNELLQNLDQFLIQSQGFVSLRASNQSSLFMNSISESQTCLNCVAYSEWSLYDKLHKEMGSLGFYLSSHPLSPFQDNFADLKIVSHQKLMEVMQNQVDGLFVMGGVILGKQERTSKSGNKFAFVQFSDLSGTYETTLFSEVYLQNRERLNIGALFVLEIAARSDGAQVRLNVQNLKSFDEALQRIDQTITVLIKNQEELNKIKDILAQVKTGRTQITLDIQEQNRSIKVQLPQRYLIDGNLKHALKSL